MKIAVKVSAPNGKDGAPQRGWAVYEPENRPAAYTTDRPLFRMVGFVRETYGGNQSLYEVHGTNVPVLCDIRVSARDFRRMVRGEYFPRFSE